MSFERSVLHDSEELDLWEICEPSSSCILLGVYYDIIGGSTYITALRFDGSVLKMLFRREEKNQISSAVFGLPGYDIKG